MRNTNEMYITCQKAVGFTNPLIYTPHLSDERLSGLEFCLYVGMIHMYTCINLKKAVGFTIGISHTYINMHIAIYIHAYLYTYILMYVII